jgi:hypothetical protein
MLPPTPEKSSENATLTDELTSTCNFLALIIRESTRGINIKVHPPTKLSGLNIIRAITQTKGRRLYTKAVRAGIKRLTQTLRKARKDAKGDYLAF